MRKCRTCEHFIKLVGVGKCKRFNKFRSDHCSCIEHTRRIILAT